MPNYIVKVFSSISITDCIDILIVAIIIYKLLGFVRQTRAEQLVKGLAVLVITTVASEYLHFYTLHWILKNTMSLGVVALVIVFQPELRRGLEHLGRSKFINVPFGGQQHFDKEKAKEMTSQFVKAVDKFSSNRVGALIILERETSLNDIAETGTILNADITTELLGNIFYEGAPLHDGAVIIRGDKIYAAGCVLPLTQNKSLSKDLGTRHRAGIGITENSDAISLIVSEETGVISVAVDGKLTRFLDIKTVEKTLLNLFLNVMDEEKNVAAKSLAAIFNVLGRKGDATK